MEGNLFNKELNETYLDLINNNELDRLRIYRKSISKLIEEDKLNFLQKVALKFYVNNFLNHEFTYKLLTSIKTGGKINYPIPQILFSIFEKDNIKLNKIGCFLKFQFSLIEIFLIAFIKLLNDFFRRRDIKSYDDAVLILNLNQNNIPQSDVGYRSSLFEKLKKLPQFKSKKFYTTAKLKYEKYAIYNTKNIYPNLSLIEFALYILISAKTIWVAFFSFFTGKWERVILLREIILKNRIYVSSLENLFSYYVIPDSNSIYKPLWIYEIEKKGKEVYLFEYSMSNNPLPINKEKIDVDFLKIRDWKTIFFINEHSKNKYLKSNRNIESKYIIGNYDYETFYQCTKIEKEKFILVYNYRLPKENYFGFSYLNDYGYSLLSTSKNFLSDIIESNRNNFKIFLKQKRAFNPNHHNNCLENFIKGLVIQNKIIEIPHSFSNIQISKYAKAIISIPFTSTAHLNKNVPNIYYDVTGKISKEDPASFGVEILNNKESLSNWLKIIK